MTARGAVLENHTLVVRDGRILDILPTVEAAERYTANVAVERATHVLMPGLVNARTQFAPPAARAVSPSFASDERALCIAEMLASGTTCCCVVGYSPDESARALTAQGMRALIGIPIAETATAWAQGPDEYLTRALNLRDELKNHPTLGTAFAPLDVVAIDDRTLGRIATLADELDAAVLIALHGSRQEIDACVARHGRRPIERLHALGLLTPALTAAHMVHVDAREIALAQRSGIAVTLSPESALRTGEGAPPVDAWSATGLRLAIGTGPAGPGASLNLWHAVRQTALLGASGGADIDAAAWSALSAATRGGAAALGMEDATGTLEPGKWADLCCLDSRSPALVRAVGDMATRLIFNGGRSGVSDVWVAGRHLLDDGEFTRLDWPALAARVGTRSKRPTIGESE